LIQPDRWRQIDDLFAEALERPAGEREAFLAAACGEDGELRRAVESLLAADEASSTFLERPAGELLGFVPELEGRLGPYRLLRRLGDGGMGTVYLARREDEHYERDVAIKVIRSGLQSPEALHRFVAERQILARLEHPNIARLYDGGSTEDGRPYLVMELVEGVPVDDYCDEHQLSIDQRLDLFRRICGAVQYAHQNLLVHRDLKPANILVTAAGEPKLLDFGIAKRLEPGSSTEPNLTQTGMRMMTPVYASPEQVRGEAIATTSDVYSLGVLLYELLAGRSPYRVVNGLPHEIELAICEQEPERPSLALFRAVDGAPTPVETAHARASRPQALHRRLRGDLDNIVLMALRKEPERRYGSAAQLSRDLESHLQNLPVVARPDTLPYRLRKFVRRHRAGAAAAAVVALLIAGFIVSLIVQGRRIARERDKARYSLSFLLDTFKDADPYHTKGERLTADEIMTRGAERVSRDLSRQPDVQAALMDAIGEVERGLGRYDRAEPLLARGLALRSATFGPSSLEVADSLEHLGRLKQDRSAVAESEDLLRRALAIRRSRPGGQRLETARALNELGELLVVKGESAEAEKLHREALSVATRVENGVGPTVAESLLLLAKAKKEQGNYASAERIARQGLVVERRVLGPRDPSLYRFQTSIGEVLIDAGKYREAESLLRASLGAQRRILGREHPDVALTLGNLATALYRQGRWAESEAVNREALAIVRTQFGPSHWLVDSILGDLAAAIDAQGRCEEAIRYQQEALEIRRRNFGPESSPVARSLLLLAGAHRRLRHYPQAIRFAQKGLDILEKIHDPHVDSALREIGRDYLEQGRAATAEPYLRRALEIRRKQLSPTHIELAKAEITLAQCLGELGRTAEAESLVRKAEPIVARQAGAAGDQVKEIRQLKARLQIRER
jgi:serine/threonine protein kinase/Tfp pilus assembly protein PilF